MVDSKYNLNDNVGAISDYSKAIEISSDIGAYYENRGHAKRELKDYNGAIADYNKSIQINPNNAVYYKNRGYVKRKLGDIKGADIDELRHNNLCGNANRSRI